MLMGTPLCQQEVSIIQSFNSKGFTYLSQFIAFVRLPFLICILSTHTKALAWVRKCKTQELAEKNTLNLTYLTVN